MEEKQYINLKIEKEKELYNPFDPEKNLSEDVKEYILNRVSDKKWNDALCIRIIHREPVSEKDVKEAFLRWIDLSGSERRRDAKKDFVTQICLFVIGIILIALSIFLQEKVSPVHFAIISTLGTFSIWEGASIWIIRSPALRRQRKIFKRLEEAADIEFVSADSMD